MAEFALGQIISLNKGEGPLATIRYVGEPHFSQGEWVGVELDDESGKNDGSVQGERYFDCSPGRGMFVRPNTIRYVEKAAPASLPAAKPSRASVGLVKKPARPSSVAGSGVGRRLSNVPDVGASKRVSVNSVSPTPAARSRPSSMLRSPTKSPTKQLSTATSTASRTGTPSSARPLSTTTTRPTRPSMGGVRTSMGPPAAPAAPANKRQSLVGGTGVVNRESAAPPRTSGRLAVPPKPRAGLRPGTDRIGSIGSQLSGRGSSKNSQDTEDEDRGSPVKSDENHSEHGSFSPMAASPVLSRTSAMDRQQASPSSTRSTNSPVAQRNPGSTTTASREIEDLKTKLRVMEKKRMEDRDKLKAMEQVRIERDKYENIIGKLQTKYQLQLEEMKKLKQELKEQEIRFDSVESMQEEHSIELEHAVLDREMAEAIVDNLKSEVKEQKDVIEELRLELDIAKAENSELSGGLTVEEKSTQGWLQMERTNERLKEALMRLRDMTQQTEVDLKSEIKTLEGEVSDLTVFKDQYLDTKRRLDESEANAAELSQRLEDNDATDDLVVELSDKNLTMEADIQELKSTIEDLESLRELNDELEINHVEAEKEMQEDIDFKESIINEQARRAAQQERAIEDMEYTLSRFRDLVTNLQNDIDDMRASHAVTETESEQLNARSRAMMELNMKLQVSAAKTQIKTIELELRRLDAREASDHLDIVQKFLPDSFTKDDRESVLAYLRFKRVAFKANLLHGFVKERVNSSSFAGHEDDIFAGCDVLDKLSWIIGMCDRFISYISHCSVEDFARFKDALLDLEPVERALNGWIDGLRRDELKEKQCSAELKRTLAVISSLAEVHISHNLASYADDIHMRALVMQSHLESAAAALTVTKSMVQTILPSQDDDELAQHFNRKSDAVITQTRNAKVIISKALRALADLKSRSLSLAPDTIQAFEQCEASTEELANFTRHVGIDLYTLLREEGQEEPHTYAEVQSTVHRSTSMILASSEQDLFSIYLSKLRTLTASLVDLAAMASDLEITQEFELATAPWNVRSDELKSFKAVPVDAEDELRRLKEENHERATMIAMRDQTIDESTVKIELLESRMRDATKKNERIHELERKIEEAQKQEATLKAIIDKHYAEITRMEADGEKLKRFADEARIVGIIAPGSNAGHERAVATAREMEILKSEIESLQAAVRYLREDNRRARLTDHRSLAWLAAPLVQPKTKEQERKESLAAEANKVLNELLVLIKTTMLYDLSTLPKDRLAWRPAKNSPQYYVAKQREDFEAWCSWRLEVERKGKMLAEGEASKAAGMVKRSGAAQVSLHLPSWQKTGSMGGEIEIVGHESFNNLKRQLGFV
ncbi:dynein associated protein-domain-containing protein [Calycina marina]|uniref:Dynein associated protein-domain-containing protein n=1 Tax=Calycina marina TaxID=1763456 RepID=A0A9P7YXD5_9HELO|nr:dynein associated protein-domain-containing protein [Calycina marina]